MIRILRWLTGESRQISLALRGSMPFDAKAVANAFINRASADKKNISALKLQKLVYYAQGYYLAAYDKPLIDENIEAWQYGPVVPSLYHEFKRFGGSPITELATDFNFSEDLPVPPPAGDKKADSVLDFVWKTYGKYTGGQLSEMTHRSGTPWHEADQANSLKLKNQCISIEAIKKHFKPLIKSAA